jgi:hypothetical protein
MLAICCQALSVTLVGLATMVRRFVETNIPSTGNHKNRDKQEDNNSFHKNVFC